MDEHGNRLHQDYVESGHSQGYILSTGQANNCYVPEDASWFEPKVYHDDEAGMIEPMQHSNMFQTVVNTQSEATASWPEAYCTARHHPEWLPVAPPDNPVNSCGSDMETLSPVSSCTQNYAPDTSANSPQGHQHSENTLPHSRNASIVASSSPFEPTYEDHEVTDAEDSDSGLSSFYRSKFYKDPNVEEKQRYCCSFVYADGETRCRKRYSKLKGVLHHCATIHDGTKALPQCWKCNRSFSSMYSVRQHLRICSA